jgi:hypothetical protein
LTHWSARLSEISQLAERQLFFVGGAPRSGTTWLQQILDSHPAISCRGEGLFMKMLAEPLDATYAAWAKTLEEKNTGLFGHTGGYPVPTVEDRECLIASAVLMALSRQIGNKNVRAVGEKTPENVFFFRRLKEMFPAAKFIGIARDPRDVLTSAWHFFRRSAAAGGDDAAKRAFIEGALPSLAHGAKALIDLSTKFPSDCLLLTYRVLQKQPAETITRLFAFLGVSDHPDIVAATVNQTSFESMTGGRPAGSERRGEFLRKGVVGDWTLTLTQEQNELVLRELGWTFPYFGWTP